MLIYRGEKVWSTTPPSMSADGHLVMDHAAGSIQVNVYNDFMAVLLMEEIENAFSWLNEKRARTNQLEPPEVRNCHEKPY
jgi:hypothetical protein